MVISVTVPWMDATLRIVKVTHCTRLHFVAPPASKGPAPTLISVDELPSYQNEMQTEGSVNILSTRQSYCPKAHFL